MSDRALNNPGLPADGPAALKGADAVRPADGYAGDISPELAWQWAQDGTAVIVDVRTDAEREWVGFVPGAVALAWKQWPQMQIDPAFETGLQRFEAGTHLLMLCRSGVRSVAAARAATAQGLQAYNILEGFEGDRNSTEHRGELGGWRFRGLPWSQN